MNMQSDKILVTSQSLYSPRDDQRGNNKHTKEAIGVIWNVNVLKSLKPEATVLYMCQKQGPSLGPTSPCPPASCCPYSKLFSYISFAPSCSLFSVHAVFFIRLRLDTVLFAWDTLSEPLACAQLPSIRKQCKGHLL